jgi:hypothetical protein
MKKLPKQVRELLSDCEKLSQIAADGREKVMEHHLWRNRADQIVAWIES